MKGIVLAGGTGSRLWPMTRVISKQLIPIYDKPMVYYPISTLMLAGIRQILLITTPQDLVLYKNLLGDGTDFGVDIEYEAQESPRGIAESLIIAKHFLAGESCLLVLGDNIFHGVGLGTDLKNSLRSSGAHIFTYDVANPSDYGILFTNRDGVPIQIKEKPKESTSHSAVTGLYFFDNFASEIASRVKPSSRGELEITAVIDDYLKRKALTYTKLGRGTAWLDTGTPQGLSDASIYVKILEERTGLSLGCLEEISYRNGWLDRQQMHAIIEKFRGNTYGKYLERVLSADES